MALADRLPSPTVLRFAAVGCVNTAIDLGLFLLLAGPLGVVGANLVSTSAGMAFSFVVNGLVTFGAGRLTLRHATLFVSTTGAVMWVLQPVVIGLLDGVVAPLALVKLLAIGVSLGANYAAYRYVVWPTRLRAAVPVSSGPRP